jgi:hypothetical protein
MTNVRSHLFWIDDELRIDGLPGTWRRRGRQLHLLATAADDICADGHPVDGLQLVRTDAKHRTSVDLVGARAVGVVRAGRVGVEVSYLAG